MMGFCYGFLMVVKAKKPKVGFSGLDFSCQPCPLISIICMRAMDIYMTALDISMTALDISMTALDISMPALDISIPADFLNQLCLSVI